MQFDKITPTLRIVGLSLSLGIENVILTLETAGSSETQANLSDRNILQRVFTEKL
jgi:hypothetical protein